MLDLSNEDIQREIAMTHPHRITSAADAVAFMLAGRARFTLVSPKTGARFTYRVTEAERGNGWFVGLMTSSDNEGGFSYMGMVRRDGLFHRTAKSRIKDSSPGMRAFVWTLARLRAGEMPVEFWHEGRCGRCGRALTVPASIESGLGPECALKVAGQDEFNPAAAAEAFGWDHNQGSTHVPPGRGYIDLGDEVPDHIVELAQRRAAA